MAVYDAAGRVTGVAPRGEVYRRGLWHAATGVLVRSGDGERVVLHRRTPDKLVFADTWDCWAGGVVGPGEDPADAAARELAEELGITGAPLTPLRPRATTTARALPRVHLRGALGRAAAPRAHGDLVGGLGDAPRAGRAARRPDRAGRSRRTGAPASNAGSPGRPKPNVTRHTGTSHRGTA